MFEFSAVAAWRGGAEPEELPLPERPVQAAGSMGIAGEYFYSKIEGEHTVSFIL